MKKLLAMCIVLLLIGVAKGDYVYPSCDEVGVSVDPLIKWEEIEGARSYSWYLDEDFWDVYKATKSESNTDYGEVFTRSLSVQVNDLEYGTMYHWRVDAQMENRCSFEQGQIWHFTTETVPEPATLLLLGLGALMVGRKNFK